MAGYTRYSALKSTMLLSALACSQPATLPTSETRLEIVSGNGQSGSAGFELAVPLVARLRDGNGDPVAGVTVHWGTGDREGRLTPATAVTGSDGIATAVWRLGRDDGPQRAVATYADRPGVNFNAASRSGDVLQAGGLPSRQCGVFSDDVVRCWQSPDRDAAALVSLDTDLRFASLGFAVDRWCGSTRGGAIACVLDAEMMPGGIFRPDAAPVRVLATNLPVRRARCRWRCRRDSDICRSPAMAVGRSARWHPAKRFTAGVPTAAAVAVAAGQRRRASPP